MNTKLTLRLDSELISQAKRYAAHAHKSLSQVVADYFAMLDGLTVQTPKELPPITKSLQGSAKGKKVTEKDYKRHLEDKYL